MSVPGSASPLFFQQAVAAEAGYKVERSLRFNSSDNANLTRTPSSAGNTNTYTISFWMKLGALGTARAILSARRNSINRNLLFLGTGDKLQYQVRRSASTVIDMETRGVLRDTSAWYHVVISSESGTQKLYINNVEEDSDNDTGSTELNDTEDHAIGKEAITDSFPFDGYLAEFFLVDGTALTPTSFGEYDSNNNWNPKDCKDDLTFGTNGFYLDFSDNTSTTTIAEDSSGNNNDWTAANISVSSGTGNDSLIDTPTNYTADSGNNGGNYATLNPLQAGSQCTLSNGNLDLVWSGTAGHAAGSTIAVSSGKWYVEFTVGARRGLIGIIRSTYTGALNIWPGNSAYGSSSYGYYGIGGDLYNNSSSSAYGASWTTNDVIGIALDLDAGNLVFYKNGSSQGTAATGLSGSFIFAIGFSDTATGGDPGSFNFGQRPFAYTPPTGHLSLCTQNLADPTIADGSTYMNAKTYTGNGSTQAITGLNHQPDLVWIKNRATTDEHKLTDSERGVTKELASNANDLEATNADGLTAFNSDGFTLGDDNEYNTNSEAYVAWSWVESTTPGFAIVTYAGTGSSQTISHGLGAKPYLILVKRRNVSTSNWAVYSNVTAATHFMRLNTDIAKTDNAAYWNDTEPTNSVFTVNTNSSVNDSSSNYVAYCWAPVEGYSSISSYTGNGNAEGPFVHTGFRPRWIMIKRTNNTGDWHVFDTRREGYNVDNDVLLASTTAAESTTDYLDILSNGFKLRSTSTGVNHSGSVYLYAAFAEHPFKTARAR